MQTLHHWLFVMHIMVGSCALLLFWVPMLTRKGSLNHRKFGRYYAHVMYAVAATGALMAALVLLWPMAIKGELLSNPDMQEAFIQSVRRFWFFLLYLSLITFFSVRHGLLALQCKKDRAAVRSPLHLTCIALLIGGAGLLLFNGIQHDNTLHIVFAALGALIALSSLKYCLVKEVTAKQWLGEHIGGLIGSGIGAYTAFISFGGRHLFESLGQAQLLFWILPGILGSIVIAYMSQKYAR